MANPQQGMRRVLSEHSNEISRLYNQFKENRMLILPVRVEGHHWGGCIEISPQAWEAYLNHLPINITNDWRMLPL